MDFTSSRDLTIHPETGYPMHDDSKPNATVVSADDINQLVWSLNKLRIDEDLPALSFNPDDPETYSWLSKAIKSIVSKSIEKDITLYVDGAAGDDAADGTEQTPIKTIDSALRKATESSRACFIFLKTNQTFALTESHNIVQGGILKIQSYGEGTRPIVMSTAYVTSGYNSIKQISSIAQIYIENVIFQAVSRANLSRPWSNGNSVFTSFYGTLNITFRACKYIGLSLDDSGLVETHPNTTLNFGATYLEAEGVGVLIDRVFSTLGVLVLSIHSFTSSGTIKLARSSSKIVTGYTGSNLT